MTPPFLRRTGIAIGALLFLFAPLAILSLIHPVGQAPDTRAIPPIGIFNSTAQPGGFPAFHVTDATDGRIPGDAPELIGIVGRIPHDAVAMVRTDAGTTDTMRPGETHFGWRLEAITRDAALFRRGTVRRRVDLPMETMGTPMQ